MVLTHGKDAGRVAKISGGVTENYLVDDGDKLDSVSIGGVTVKDFDYDAAGRTTSVVTSAGTTTLAYDYESRVTGIAYPNSSTNSFTYNGLDTRVGKTDSSGTKTFRRDGAYVTDPVLSDGSSTFTPGLSVRTGTTSRFQHTDRLGSGVRQTNASQSVTSNLRWDAFGMLASQSGTHAGPFGFAGDWGYQQDNDSGLQLLGHRYYDPSTGRFLTRDPIQDGRNWYAYAENNPTKFVDPSGLSTKGDEAAARADGGIGKLPRDCEDWILRFPYPGEWPNGRAHEVPGKLKGQDDWIQVKNDGNFQPGDLIIIDQGNTGTGHIIVVGDQTRKNPKTGKADIEINDASLRKRPGTRGWIPVGRPYVDPHRRRGGKVSVWRPVDVVKTSK